MCIKKKLCNVINRVAETYRKEQSLLVLPLKRVSPQSPENIAKYQVLPNCQLWRLGGIFLLCSVPNVLDVIKDSLAFGKMAPF